MCTLTKISMEETVFPMVFYISGYFINEIAVKTLVLQVGASSHCDFSELCNCNSMEIRKMSIKAILACQYNLNYVTRTACENFRNCL